MGGGRCEATRNEQRDAEDPDLQLCRRFTDVLERDYARHHDAPHSADEVPERLPIGYAAVTSSGDGEARIARMHHSNDA